MTQFSTSREAKEFLVSRIVEEAQREKVPLSEVERKMLYFTESGWTLPDIMEVSDKFDRDYDQGDYEKKIAGLIKNAVKRNRKDNPQDAASWNASVLTLSKEDHYILVMIRQAGVSARPPGDRLKLWATGFAIVAFVLSLSWLSAAFKIDFGKYFPTRGTMSFVIWASVASITIAYFLASLLFGKKRMSDLFAKSLEKFFGRTVRDK